MGMVFAYSVLPTPPLSAGAGLDNRTTHLWHRIRFWCFWWSEFRWFMAYSVVLSFFALPIPAALEPGQ